MSNELDSDLPESVSVRVDLKHGAAYFYLNSETEIEFTIPDCGGYNINVDVNKKGEIFGVEDISKEMSDVVKTWLKAIMAAKSKQGVANLKDKHDRKE